MQRHLDDNNNNNNNRLYHHQRSAVDLCCSVGFIILHFNLLKYTANLNCMIQDPDQYQNLAGCFLNHAPSVQKKITIIHSQLIEIFCTHRQTHKTVTKTQMAQQDEFDGVNQTPSSTSRNKIIATRCSFRVLQLPARALPRTSLRMVKVLFQTP